jgi:hypothetical protein
VVGVKKETEYFTHSIPGLQLAAARAYEVVKPHENGERERCGWVIETDTGGVAHWVAWAILSATGDSFLGGFPTADAAIRAIWANETALERQRAEATS